jgi:hypothetical protein
VGEIRGSGELEDIGWVSIPRALDLPIPTITKTVLHLIARLAVDTSRSDPGRPVPLYRHRYGRYEFVEE